MGCGPSAAKQSTFGVMGRGLRRDDTECVVRPVNHTFSISRHDLPELCKGSPHKKREQGMPGARCTRGLACKTVRKGAHEHTGSAETLRHPPRNGLTAYAVLTPATNSSCHRRCRLEAETIRSDRSSHRQLGTSNGCRVHTVLPYAASRLRQLASPGFGAVHPARREPLTGNPPCDHLARRRRCVHRIPSQRS